MTAPEPPAATALRAAGAAATAALQAADIVHSGENLTGRGAHSTSTFVSHSLP